MASNVGLIFGFPVDRSNAAMTISHLLFADDTIIFYGSDCDEPALFFYLV